MHAGTVGHRAVSRFQPTGMALTGGLLLLRLIDIVSAAWDQLGEIDNPRKLHAVSDLQSESVNPAPASTGAGGQC